MHRFSVAGQRASSGAGSGFFQEKIQAMPVRRTTYANHKPKAIEMLLPAFIFRELMAAKPMPMRIRIQNVKRSTCLHSVTSHFSESSGKNAAAFAATGFSKSKVPGGFRKRISRNKMVLTPETRKL